MLAVQPEFFMCVVAVVFWRYIYRDRYLYIYIYIDIYTYTHSCFLPVRVLRPHLGKGGKVNTGPSGRKEHLKEWNVETGCSKHNRNIKRNETSFWTSRKGERRQKC